MSALPLDARFEQAKARFLDGLACFQTGRFADAEQHYLASLALLPERASTLINLAAAQLQLSHPAEALATADKALALEPDSADALIHRATALQQLGRFDDALRAFNQLLAIDGATAEGWLRHAQTLERLGRPTEALTSFERVLALDPAHAQAWSGSGTLLRELLRLDEAAHAFREALRHGADPELHAYYLSSVDGQRAPSTAPRAYVQTLFDDYADEFDEHLVGQLHYQAHRQLIGALASLARGPYRSALDLGCGTGLCGPLVRPMVERLTGLDLSPRMLEKARALGVYDRLEHADVVEHLSRTAERHDLVLAADVFIYVGDLDPVFSAVRRVMDRGVFCFSVELVENNSAAEFQLLSSLRYAHSEAYLHRLAAQHGFEILDLRRAPVRQDQRESIDGLFAYLAPIVV